VIYPFRPFPTSPSRAYPLDVIYRPVIPIWIGAPGGRRLPYYGLLDTGSDDTKMSFSEAERLGVTVDRSDPILFRGLGGIARGYYGEVVLELRQSPRSWVWSAKVAFVPDEKEDAPEDRMRVILGHAGFFRHFHASFDFQRGRARVRPNGLFVGLGS